MRKTLRVSENQSVFLLVQNMYTETEAKFYVKDLGKLATRLEALGAAPISPRTHEMNLRFDMPAGTLSAQACVLRLRQDAQSRLTFKSPGTSVNGVLSREEIEFAVSDFDSAQRFLERLGYKVVATYEKYRTTYQLDTLRIMLDEMPYGDFIEIEGAPHIRSSRWRKNSHWMSALPSKRAISKCLNFCAL